MSHTHTPEKHSEYPVADMVRRLIELEQQRDTLLSAGKALVDRWDIPPWKDAPRTGEFIAILRAAIASIESPTQEQAA